MKLRNKDFSELPQEIEERIYSLRLYQHRDMSFDDYMFFVDFVVVEDTVYFKNTDDNWAKYRDVLAIPENSYKFGYLPNIIIKDGVVTKNRYGNPEKR